MCSGSTIILDAGNPGFSYTWNTTRTTQTISVSAAGTYDVTVAGGGVGCLDTDQIMGSTQAAHIVDLGEDTTICTGASVHLDVSSPGDDYLWNTSEITQMISVGSAEEFGVVVTDSAGCPMAVIL